MERLLLEYESRRRAWVARISQNQRMLLNSIPTAYTSLDILWKTALKVLPGCGYKEFRFRLHELEWLGLVERRPVPAGTWEYRQVSAELELRNGQG